MKHFILIVFCILLAYFPTLFNDFVLDDVAMLHSAMPTTWRDSSFFLLNPVNSVTILHYRPFTYFSFFIDRNVWGDCALGFHISNIIIAIATAYVLYRFLCMIFSKNYALCGTILFSIFPGHSEAIINICNRSQALSLVFMLVAIIYFLKSINKKSPIYYFFYGSLATFFSCISKETGCMTPALCFILCFLYDSKNKKNIIFHFIAQCSAILIYLGLRYYATSTLGIPNTDPAVKPNGIISLFFYSFRILAEYLRLSFFPYPLSCDYNLQLTSPHWTGILFLLLPFSAIALFSHKRIIKLYGISFLWFYICLFPVLNWIPMQITFAERLLYPAFVGIVIFLLSCCERLNKSKIMTIGYIILIMFFIVQTNSYSQIWKNNDTLWQRTAKVAKNSFRSEIYLGLNCTLQKQYAEAEQHYNNALQRNINQHNKINVYYNLAYLYICQDNIEKTLQMLDTVFSYAPHHRLARRLQGTIYQNQGEYAKAIECYLQARKPLNKFDQGYSIFYHNISVCYSYSGNLAKAIQYSLQATSISPNNIPFLQHLATLYNETGQSLQYYSCLQKIRKLQKLSGKL